MKQTLFFLIIGITQNLYADMKHMGHMEDDPLISMVIIDRLEVHDDTEQTKMFEGSFWLGYDLHKIYLYSETEATSDALKGSQNDIVYSHAIAPYWDVQMGFAYDKNDDASKTWAEIALAGLAPYYFETRAALLISEEGTVGFRFDVEYEALLTQKLILTPSLEADFYTANDAKMRVGSGLSNIEAGLRLRYEIQREFAPYIGVTWEKTFGNTRDYMPIDETNLLLGVRIWF